MSEKKENFSKKLETKKSPGEKLISIYYFGYMINIGVFGRFREVTRDLIKKKSEEIFYPKKSSQNFPQMMKNMVEKHFEGKRDLILLEKSGENDTFFEIVSNFIDNFNFENFIEFENRNALIYYFSELDIYLFKCFKFLLNKNPDILNDTTVSLKELRNVSGNINRVIDDKAEEKAMSKFDLNLFIDEVIEKKIHNKFYRDYTEIFHFAERILGVKHSIHEDLINLLNFFKQIRNLYTHGDGTINQIFLKRIEPLGIKKEKYRKGEKVQLTDELVEDLQNIIGSTIIQFDKSLTVLYPELLYKSKEKSEI